MIPLFPLFLLAISVRSCKEANSDCGTPFDDTKFTVDQVIADINQTLTQSSEYYANYATNMHKFTVDMESRLKADRILLERLLKLQLLHGKQIHKTQAVCNEDINKTTVNPSPLTTVTTPTTKGTTAKIRVSRLESNSEKCRAKIVKSEILCENCSIPIYDDINMIFTCTKGFAFDIEMESRQVRCDFAGSRLQLVYESHETSGVYNGNLACFPLSPENTNRHNCSYSCAQTATCNDINSKLECACLKGYIDISAKFEKPPGSICTKCNNSVPQGTDFVMLFDVSGSITHENNRLMIDFVSTFLNFIDIDNTNNQFSLIQFGTVADLRFPLTPKTSSAQIIKTLKSNASRYKDGGTNTPDALKIANDEVYAKLPATHRPRVTILFTDGAPETCNACLEDITDVRNMDTAEYITPVTRESS